MVLVSKHTSYNCNRRHLSSYTVAFHAIDAIDKCVRSDENQVNEANGDNRWIRGMQGN